MRLPVILSYILNFLIINKLKQHKHQFKIVKHIGSNNQQVKISTINLWKNFSEEHKQGGKATETHKHSPSHWAQWNTTPGTTFYKSEPWCSTPNIALLSHYFTNNDAA